ncbi:carbohydrate ABC transporter permease [Paenibacillus doosanensis]|uniref:L-arabinose transport system permease protein AraQ n=1 Tax=Paenibacillus konkukensis TaxID=2020716 RepID=A0ABY4RSA8_9BACL|nr:MULTISPECIES: carbohydrate ABC transporter permease [Paenibacillus]MCS7462043.1 carbohydrate ABC transporter permease [Paenibacillus doosanensis]UQZ85110.1 L-arabinose transport system permease protein AraQ [Paenibacillus konkukensis]
MTSKQLNGIVYILLIIAAALVLYPVFFTVSSAFMTPAESSAYPPKFVPGSLYWDNLIKVTQTVPIFKFITNSLLVSAAIMLGQIVTASLAAYAFAYLKFAGKSVLFAVFLSTMMIPWEVTMIPNYLTVKSWGWLDTYEGLIVPFLASAFGTFLLRQFFMQLPSELFEAARIDGCGHLRSFLRIVLPLSRPALATLGVYSFLTHWNMYLWPLLITNDEKMRTVQIGISMLQFEEMTSWNLVLAGVTIVMLPSLLLLVLGIKQLVRGLTAGALKG